MNEPYTVAEAIELLSACDPNALLTRTEVAMNELANNMTVIHGLRGIEDRGPTVRLHFFGDSDE